MKKQKGLILLRRVGNTFMMAAAMSLLYADICFAEDLQSTTLFTGTQNLLKAATTALTALAGVITIFLAVKGGIEWQAADEQEKPAKKRKMVAIVGAGILVVCISGLVTVIFTYYGANAGV